MERVEALSPWPGSLAGWPKRGTSSPRSITTATQRWSQSICRSASLSGADAARVLSVLLDKLIADPAFGPRIDMNRVGVAGFSLGGYTALTLAGARTDYAQWQHYCDKAPSDRSCKLTAEADFGMDKMKLVLDTDARARASLARAGDNYRNERVRAAFAMAPALALAFDKASLAHISIPVSMLVGENDDQAPPLSNAALLATQIPMAQ